MEDLSSGARFCFIIALYGRSWFVPYQFGTPIWRRRGLLWM